MSLPAIRVVSSTAKSALGAIYLQCRIKPGASKQREGIISISDEVIEVCVSARAQEGEANRSVRDLFSSVLKCPKSDIEIVRGLKSREKTIAIRGFENENKEACLKQVRDMLSRSIESV